MVSFRPLPAVLSSLALCCAISIRANAATFSTSGTFTADNDVYKLNFNETAPDTFTASTTGFASGGFLPVLTLFNSTTGAVIDNNGTGFGDVSLTDALGVGSYVLYLTEFPNVANGNLPDGFLLASSPTATGDICGVPGGTFYNTITCTETSGRYAFSANVTAVTPEPASWLLVLAPAALLFASRRRFV